MKILLLAFVVLFSGCDNAHEKVQAVRNVLQSCKSDVRFSVQLGGWNEHMRMECDMPASGIK